MLALKPPFVGKDMNTLFRNVCEGKYPKIPDHYSAEIWNTVKQLLQVDPKKRPTCYELINSSIFKKYSKKLMKLKIVDPQFEKTMESHR